MAMHIKYFAMSLSTPNDDAVAPKTNPILLIHAATVANDVRKSYPIPFNTPV